MSETARWYVIHTYSGYENKVAQTIQKVVDNRKLHELIPEIRVPTEMAVEKKDDKTKEVERKVFPGYVLVKMILTDDSWYVVRNTRGVTGFVGPGSKPIPLSDKEVEKLSALSSDNEQKPIEVDFSVGDNVQITDGSLEGFVGIVQKIDIETQTVDVIVSMFGRETPATLGLMQVSKLKNY
jgi:transcriptional antiterminator NusG